MKYVIAKNHMKNYFEWECSESKFWGKIISMYSEQYSEITKLISIAMMMPMVSVACENGFSSLTYIKNKYRSCLGKSNFILLISIRRGIFRHCTEDSH